MSETEEKTDELTGNPLIIYLNFLQRQKLVITDQLYNKNVNVNRLKRQLLGLIDNLPPIGMKKFQIIRNHLKKNTYIGVNLLSDYYNEINAWTYTELFKETNFGITPTATLKGGEETPDGAPLKPESSRI